MPCHLGYIRFVIHQPILTMYKTLVLIFVIVAIVVVAYKEYGERDKTNPNYIFKKLTRQIFEIKKIPEKKIVLTSEFKRHLSMHEGDVDTLALKMMKEMDLSFYVENFRKSKTVGEAVDFLRVKAEAKEKKLSQRKSVMINQN